MSSSNGSGFLRRSIILGLIGLVLGESSSLTRGCVAYQLFHTSFKKKDRLCYKFRNRSSIVSLSKMSMPVLSLKNLTAHTTILNADD